MVAENDAIRGRVLKLSSLLDYLKSSSRLAEKEAERKYGAITTKHIRPNPIKKCLCDVGGNSMVMGKVID